jgi:hypothetical protein
LGTPYFLAKFEGDCKYVGRAMKYCGHLGKKKKIKS